MTDKINDKMNDIETSYGLLQRDFEAQNETILWLTSRVKELEKAVAQLTSQLENLDSAGEEADLLEQKPPHY